MLKSMKQKFGGRKAAAGPGPGKDDGPGDRPGPQRAGSSLLSASLDRRASGSGGARNSFGGRDAAGRDKPPLPVLSEARLAAAYAEALPAFREVPTAEKQLLFVRKLHLCAFTFDFGDQSKHVREKEVKR